MNVLIDHKETTYIVHDRQNLDRALSFQIICSVLSFWGQTNKHLCRYVCMCKCVNYFWKKKNFKIFSPNCCSIWTTCRCYYISVQKLRCRKLILASTFWRVKPQQFSQDYPKYQWQDHFELQVTILSLWITFIGVADLGLLISPRTMIHHSTYFREWRRWRWSQSFWKRVNRELSHQNNVFC